MAIPGFPTLMLPLLELVADEQEHCINDVLNSLSDKFNLTKKERNIFLKSSKHTIMRNRVSWAATYLRKSNIIKSTKRGYFKITQRGIDILKQKPSKIDRSLLEQFPEFRKFVSFKNKNRKVKTINLKAGLSRKNKSKSVKQSNGVKWTPEIRKLLYENLVKEFGPYSEWTENDRIPNDKTKYYEFLRNWAKILSTTTGKKFTEDSIRMQINWALTSQENITAAKGYGQSFMSYYILNKAVALEVGFITRNSLPSAASLEY